MNLEEDGMRLPRLFSASVNRNMIYWKRNRYYRGIGIINMNIFM